MIYPNSYEKDNPLQLKWVVASKHVMCLCTMRESCYHCNMESTQRRRDKMNAVIVEANSVGYQLYIKPSDGYWGNKLPTPVKMVQQTVSGMEY